MEFEILYMIFNFYIFTEVLFLGELFSFVFNNLYLLFILMDNDQLSFKF